SPMQNHTPLTLVDFRMKASQYIVQELPANYNGLVYALNGAVRVGDKTLKAGQAGWLNQSNEIRNSELSFQSLTDDTHFVLFAAQPHNVSVVAHGPFIGNNMEDIARLYKEYRNGEMPHLNDLPKEQKHHYISE